MKTFQIRFVDSKGSGSFQYVDVKSIAYEAAVIDKANEYLEKRKGSAGFRMSCFTPIKTVAVVEYDRKTHKAVPKGIKFKLRLTYVVFTFKGGIEKRDEFYELK